MKRLEVKVSVFVVLSVMLAASLYPPRAFAQALDTVLLRGTVTDSSGAVIPGVSVTMTNVATGVSEKRPTDASAGIFSPT